MKKAEQILTLSVYTFGKNKTVGRANKSEVENFQLSFAESFTPIKDMLAEFKDVPLGTKIKVTMEVIEPK